MKREERSTMGKKARAIMLAVITMLLCVSLIAFGTYALFTDSQTLTVHLNAATLDIGLVRTNLDYNSLADDGYEYEHIGENTEVVDFTEATTRNLFDVTDDTLIAPGCWYEATLKIVNNGTVAFGWWLDVTLKGDVTELANQLEVTVTECNPDGTVKDGGRTETQLLKDGTHIGSKDAPFGHFAIGTDNTVAVFKVKVMFKNLDTDGSVNNAAQNLKAGFDVVVNAVQDTTAPAAETPEVTA